MYIPKNAESDLAKPNHKYNIGDIIKASDSFGERHAIIEGIRYDPVWYVWQYEYRILEENIISWGDIRDMDKEKSYKKVA